MSSQTPQGYLSVEEAARRLGVAVTELTKAGDAAGVPKFSSNGVLLYREADFERLKGLVRPGGKEASRTVPAAGKEASRTIPGAAARPRPAGPAGKEVSRPAVPAPLSDNDADTLADADLEALLGPAPESGIFDLENIGMSSGAFEAVLIEHAPKPAVAPAAASAPPASAPPRPTGAAAPPARFADAPDDPAKVPPTIDHRHWLLLDGSIIDTSKGAARVLNQPAKFPGNPVVLPDTPWEADGLCTSATVLYDREEYCFKMWYYAVTKLGRSAGFAASPDGLKWTKPDAGVIRHAGAGTNLVMAHPQLENYGELLGVIKDPDDEPQRRYKALVLIQPPTGTRSAKTAVSPDGFVWTVSPVCVGALADIGHFFKDERTGRFVVYGRNPQSGRRSVVRWESPDFLNWTEGPVVIAPDERDPEGDDVYSLAVFPAGHGYVGLTQMFHGAPHYTLDHQLSFSRDGVRWDRSGDRALFLPQGRVGDWDRYQLSCGGRPVVIGGKELWFYYGCRCYRHPPYLGNDKGPGWGAIGVARLRMDGFLHLEASYDGATVVTHPLILKNPGLRLNVAALHGVMAVSVLDAGRNPLPGMSSKPMSIDSVDAPVTWSGGRLEDHLGKPVRLAFTFKNARLFSFWTQ
jgi:hypothetical protein